MEEKTVIQYKDYLQNFIHIFQYINIIFIILGIIALAAPLELGFKIAGILFVVLAGCISYLMFKTKSFELSFNKDNWSYRHHTYSYDDIKSFVQTDRHFEITTDKKIVLDIMNFEVESLSEMLDILASHNITLRQKENTSAINKLFSYESMRIITLVFAAIDWLYLLFAFRKLSNMLVVAGLLSLVPPVFFAIFYVYRLLRGDLEVLDKLSTNLMMVFLLPVIAGFIVMYTNFSISKFTLALVVTGVFFIFFMIYYTMLRTLVASPAHRVFISLKQQSPTSAIWMPQWVKAISSMPAFLEKKSRHIMFQKTSMNTIKKVTLLKLKQK
ncbi:hypothetical protein [Sharpea azabuensis]|uniref:hypothetical protein n=1 Tax=Sharpea azabuensis TaxID=322505 RepID=UPI0013DC6503|nr:hypothetical protein [Sharpea azabuensis]